MKQITTYPNTDSLALPTPPLAHGPDHAQARALALQVVPPTAYHAQFSVEQRAAYNLAQAYLALAPQPSAPPQERVSEAVREVLSRCEDFRRNPSASGTANATFEHIAQILTAALAPPQERVSEARIGIESHLGLHQVVELRYLVDCFEAVLLTQDGDKLVACGTGTNVADAMEQLLAALAPSRRAPSGDGGGENG